MFGHEYNAPSSDSAIVARTTTSANLRESYHTTEVNGGNLRNLPISSSGSGIGYHHGGYQDTETNSSRTAAIVRVRSGNIPAAVIFETASSAPAVGAAFLGTGDNNIIAISRTPGNSRGGAGASGYFGIRSGGGGGAGVQNNFSNINNSNPDNIRSRRGSGGGSRRRLLRRTERRANIFQEEYPHPSQEELQHNNNRKDRLVLWMRELELTWIQITLLISEFLWFLKNHGIPRWSHG